MNLSKKILLLTFTIAIAKPIISFSQENFSVTAGVGFPELLNIGASYQISQIQFGASVGTAAFLDEHHKKMNSLTGYAYYHFKGKSKCSARNPWHLRSGITYMWGETTSIVYNNLLIDLRIGRDFYLTDNFGFDINIGPAVVIYEREVFKNNPPFLDLNWWLFPSAGLRLYYIL